VIEVVCGLLIQDDRILVARRRRGRDAGLWEFPGGKVEPAETPAQAISRELGEELGVRATVGPWVATTRDGRVELLAFHVPVWAGVPQALEHSELHWAAVAELGALAMPEVDRQLLGHVEALLAAYN
jgi:mutator protein MutT